MNQNTGTERIAVCLRKAYIELPDMVAGVEACTQIYDESILGATELMHEQDRFQGLGLIYVDPNFFKVFQLTFIEGAPQTALTNPKTLVITRPYAEKIFGSTGNAMGKTVSIKNVDYTIDAVVEPLPSNTHFSFDLLGEIESHFVSQAQSLEFYTYYLINAKSSVREVRRSIEQTYNEILAEDFAKRQGVACYGETELLTDIYLHSKAEYGLGKRSDFKFVLLLSLLSFVILLFAISNFMNLFLAQGETRMGEIGIRKANGAGLNDLVKQFFSEVSFITLIAFILGLLLALISTPFFSKLIEREVAMRQLIDQRFILSIIAAFSLTVLLSAGYPSFYLSRFKPLDMLTKRLNFGRHRITTIVIIIQSAVAIVLITCVLVVDRQTVYLENLPIGINPKNVMMVQLSQLGRRVYEIREELQNDPQVISTSASIHQIGAEYSQQYISTPEDAENTRLINEYRISEGFGELMEIQLTEGRFYREDDPNNAKYVILNEAAVRMLGIAPPYLDKEILYNGRRLTIMGITRDFCYHEPGTDVLPLILTYSSQALYIYIRFHDGLSRASAAAVVTETFRKFDSEYVLNPRWSKDLYDQKFTANRTRSKTVLSGSLLSIILATLGLLAIQSFVTIRRTKEIGLRRINGATKASLIWLLMYGLVKLILIAGVIAIPVAWYLSSNWLSSYAYRIRIDWSVFVVPILIQCLVVALVTWGVTHKALSTNPIEILKSE